MHQAFSQSADYGRIGACDDCCCCCLLPLKSDGWCIPWEVTHCHSLEERRENCSSSFLLIFDAAGFITEFCLLQALNLVSSFWCETFCHAWWQIPLCWKRVSTSSGSQVSKLRGEHAALLLFLSTLTACTSTVNLYDGSSSLEAEALVLISCWLCRIQVIAPVETLHTRDPCASQTNCSVLCHPLREIHGKAILLFLANRVL